MTKQDLQELFESFAGLGKTQKLSAQVIGSRKPQGSFNEDSKKKDVKVEVTKEKLSDENDITSFENFKANLSLNPMVKFSIQ